MLLPILGKGIFTSDGGEWSQYRALIRPCFTKTHLRDLRMFEPHVQNLISQIPKDGVPVDMQELFYDLTMDVTTDFLFGHSAGSLLPDASQENKDFSEAFAHALGRALHRGNLGFLMNWIPDRQFRKSCATVHQFVDKLVKQALDHSSTKNQYVYLHEVLKTTSSPEELRNHAINILIAGRDTTATLLSSIIYLLSRHKVEWERICGEVEHLNGKAPTYKQLKGLKYVHYTMNEALRLYTPIPVNMRLATSNTILPVGGGPTAAEPVFFRKGDAIVYSVSSMHRRKDIWGDDADEFRPSRWENRQSGWEFLPFNGGPRICIGQSFALTEVAYIIVRLIQTFETISSGDDSVWGEKLGLTLASFNGVFVGCTARQ